MFTLYFYCPILELHLIVSVSVSITSTNKKLYSLPLENSICFFYFYFYFLWLFDIFLLLIDDAHYKRLEKKSGYWLYSNWSHWSCTCNEKKYSTLNSQYLASIFSFAMHLIEYMMFLIVKNWNLWYWRINMMIEV